MNYLIFIKSLLLSFFINIYFLFNVSAQKWSNIKITDSIDYKINKNVLGSFYKFTMVNDYNPALKQMSNDEGYTLGVFHEVRIQQPKIPRFFDIALISDLYTYYSEESYEDNGRRIDPQEFTEISALKVSYNKYIAKKRLFLSLETGFGLRNKKQAIKGLALFMQGGIDGRGGYHGLLEGHVGQDNIRTGDTKPFVFIAPSVIKHFMLTRYKINKDQAYIQTQAGFSLGTSQIKSKIFVAYNSELPILQLNIAKYRAFKTSIRARGEFLLHSDGFQYKPEIGVEVSILFFTIGYTSIFYIGQHQKSIINYYDNESSMRGYIRFRFNK